jgi:hypothetical protein
LTEDQYAAGLHRIETALLAAERTGSSIQFSAELSFVMVTGFFRKDALV